MLAWALWLALACVRWSGWVGSTFKQHGLWQPLRSKVVAKMTVPESPPASTGRPRSSIIPWLVLAAVAGACLTYLFAR